MGRVRGCGADADRLHLHAVSRERIRACRESVELEDVRDDARVVVVTESTRIVLGHRRLQRLEQVGDGSPEPVEAKLFVGMEARCVAGRAVRLVYELAARRLVLGERPCRGMLRGPGGVSGLRARAGRRAESVSENQESVSHDAKEKW